MKPFLLWFAALVFVTAAAPPAVVILVGAGEKGFSETQVNNPYGMAIGRDDGLYFCDLDNQRILRLDLKTHRLTTIAGNGEAAYRGDGGRTVEAAQHAARDSLSTREGTCTSPSATTT